METKASPLKFAAEVAGASRCYRIDGNNFSGRTEILKQMVDFGRPQSVPRKLFVGADVHASISTFMPTVRDELAFFLEGSRVRASVDTAALKLGLACCYDNNPFERALSGGQEVILAVLCRLALSPALLACDTCLEQLSATNKELLCTMVSAGLFGSTALIITDNRRETARLVTSRCVSTFDHDNQLFARLPFRDLDSGALRVPHRPPVNIALERVAYTYPRSRTPTITDASCNLNAGRVYALTGENGSGKSTLAKLLTGLLEPTRGHIRSTSGLRSEGHCTPATTAYHFQDPDSQLFETTVLAEVTTATVGAIPPSDRLAIDSVLAAFGLESIQTTHPFDLPYVMRKRLALAATVAQDRPWVILDEPTLSQDVATTNQIGAIVRSLAAAGRGVIVISHHEEFLELVTDEWLMLRDGVLLQPHRPSEKDPAQRSFKVSSQP